MDIAVIHLRHYRSASSDVAAVDGRDVGGGAFGQRLVQEGLGHVLGRDLLTEQVAGHVFLLRDAARPGAAGDHVVGQQPGADAVGIDGVGADAVGAVFQRILADRNSVAAFGSP